MTTLPAPAANTTMEVEQPTPVIRQREARSAAVDHSDHTRYARLGYIAIALAFGGLGGWAALAPLDSAAVAEANVAVSSDRKPIQHLEGGIVREILVKEAQRVKAGQVLFRLQPVQAEANADVLTKQLSGSLAKEARLLAERDMKAGIDFPSDVLAKRDEPGTARTIYDQEKIFRDRRQSLQANVAIHQRRIEQTNNDIAGKRLRERALQSQFESLSAEIKAVSGLADRGFFPKNKLRASQRELFRMQGELGALVSDIARSGEIIEESKLQIRLAAQRYVEEAARELGEVRGRLTELREKLKVARDVLTRVEVRAPQDGIIQAIKVHVVGAVVTPGQPIAEIVTLEDGLIMTAKILPDDIDTVHAGMKAEIRFPAYVAKQRRITLGKVETISADAIYDQQSRRSYYNARVVLDQDTLPEGLKGKLVPGMPASVLISTGERTVLQYLVGPLLDSVARTMRER